MAADTDDVPADAPAEAPVAGSEAAATAATTGAATGATTAVDATGSVAEASAPPAAGAGESAAASAASASAAEPPTAPAGAAGKAPPAQRARGPRALTRQEILMLAGGAFILVNVAFGVLGRMYYMDKLAGGFEADPSIADPYAAASSLAWAYVRDVFFFSFLVFSIVGTAAMTAAVLWPRHYAHAMAGAFALYYVASAIAIAFSNMPILVAVFQAAVGVLFLRLGYASWKHKDRAAWAFLLALAGVMALLLLFGAPQIKAAMHLPRLWYVMLLPALMASVAVGLYRARNEYST
jgi:hypothetical protein